MAILFVKIKLAKFRVSLIAHMFLGPPAVKNTEGFSWNSKKYPLVLPLCIGTKVIQRQIAVRFPKYLKVPFLPPLLSFLHFHPSQKQFKILFFISQSCHKLTGILLSLAPWPQFLSHLSIRSLFPFINTRPLNSNNFRVICETDEESAWFPWRILLEAISSGEQELGSWARWSLQLRLLSLPLPT